MSTRGWIAAVTGMMFINSAGAALHARDGGMVYDDVMNVTWLADMDYARSSGYHSDGEMSRDQAMAWADTLTYGGYSDWRLPTLNPKSPYFYDTSGELSHLFIVDLGNKPDESVLNQVGDSDIQRSNLALFKNIRVDANQAYWSSAKVGDYIYAFRADVGRVGAGPAGMTTLFAVAVRNGDVSAVPELGSTSYFLLGLLGVLAARSRRRLSA